MCIFVEKSVKWSIVEEFKRVKCNSPHIPYKLCWAVGYAVQYSLIFSSFGRFGTHHLQFAWTLVKKEKRKTTIRCHCLRNVSPFHHVHVYGEYLGLATHQHIYEKSWSEWIWILRLDIKASFLSWSPHPHQISDWIHSCSLHALFISSYKILFLPLDMDHFLPLIHH